MKTAITCSVLALLLASTSFALPLADMPERVGGYVLDDQAQPIEGASVAFTNQSTLDSYEGLTDSDGWYGNTQFSSVPDAPTNQVLGSAYPNPYSNSTTIEINSGGMEKNSGSANQEIELFDLRGRKVGSIPAVSGSHEVKTTSAGSLPKGTYFYRFGNEVQKMVGSPKTITVKVSPSSEKAVVEYRMVVSADGYETQDTLVYLDDSQINIISSNLIPANSTFTKPVAFQVRSIAGDQRQAIGELVLRNANGTEFLALADADSVYRTTVEVASESEFLTIFPRGITGFESMTYVILDPDSVAVRGMIADATPFNYPLFPDTTRIAFDHYALDKELFLEIVSEYWVSDGQYRQSVGVIFKRYYDRKAIVLTRFYNRSTGEFGGIVPEYALERFRTAENNFIDILENTADGIPLIYSEYYELADSLPDTFSVPFGLGYGLAYRSFDEDVNVPTNARIDFSGDGYLDYHHAEISTSMGTGTATEEVGNEFAHDINSGVLGDIYDPITYQYNARGRAVAATWAKFSNGRNFNPSLKGGGSQ